MNWTAVLPLRQGPEPKTRLSARLSAAERIALSRHMASAVLDALARCKAVENILLLSPEPPPAGMAGTWWRDEGRGLNAELDALRTAFIHRGLLVIHGDLPLVRVQDVDALIAGAEQAGCAIAPDRHGAGTNAIALAAGQPFHFAFGEGSLSRHRILLPSAMPVERPGLAIDMDTPEDMETVTKTGISFPFLAEKQ